MILFNDCLLTCGMIEGRDCGAHWTFERFVDTELRGHVRETVRDVSKTDCEEVLHYNYLYIKHIFYLL